MSRLNPVLTLVVFGIWLAACSDSDESLVDGGGTDSDWMVDASIQDGAVEDGAVKDGAVQDASIQDVFIAPDGEIRDLAVLVDAIAVDASEPVDQGVGLDAEQDAWIDPCDNLEASYVVQSEPPEEPPYGGTLFVDDGIIIDEDPTSFRGLTYAGQDERTMYDRRTSSFESYRPHLFNAQFGQRKVVEVQVNPEMSREEGEEEAAKYCRVIGQIPGFLFRDLDTVWLHRGDNAFGGGNRNLLIHTGQGERYIADGLLGEVFLHEAAHTSMDAYHQDNPSWLAAQAADGQAISRYAADFPRREDLAETLPLYLAVRFWSHRVPQQIVDSVLTTIPNRVRYLDCQGLDPAILP